MARPAPTDRAGGCRPSPMPRAAAPTRTPRRARDGATCAGRARPRRSRGTSGARPAPQGGAASALRAAAPGPWWRPTRAVAAGPPRGAAGRRGRSAGRTRRGRAAPGQRGPPGAWRGRSGARPGAALHSAGACARMGRACPVVQRRACRCCLGGFLEVHRSRVRSALHMGTGACVGICSEGQQNRLRHTPRRMCAGGSEAGRLFNSTARPQLPRACELCAWV